MNAPQEKITVRLEDIAAVSPGRLVIADLGPVSAIEPGGPSKEATTVGPAARTSVLAALVGFVAVALLIVATIALWPRLDPIQRIAAEAQNSVVRVETEQGQGTGFVVGRRGNQNLVLTNKHVIAVQEGLLFRTTRISDRCSVTLASHDVVVGHLVGLATDPGIDLALVLVESKHLTPVRIRPFRQIVVGERVVAVGHPLGLDYTITNGIVSAKRGDMLLQTTTPINPGNSGGPLFGEDLAVVGVNTLKLDNSEGLGFAFRADLVWDTKAWTYRRDVSDLVERISH